MVYYQQYKKTDQFWLASIPAAWKCLKIKHIFSERSQKGFPEEPLLVASQNMGVVPKNVYGTRTVEAQKDLHLLKLVRIGDFVISLRSFQGGIEYAYYQGIISPAYTIMIPSEVISPQYFRYLGKSKLFVELLKTCVTGIREGQNIDYQKLKNYKIPVPPRSEQDQIVRYLDWQVSKINRLILAKKKEIELVRECIDREFRNITITNCQQIKIKRLFKLENNMIEPHPDEYYQKAGMYNRGRGIFLREPCVGAELGDSSFQRIFKDRVMLSGQFAWEDAVYITLEKDEKGIASHRYYLLCPIDDVSVEYLFAYFLSSDGFFNLQQCSHGSAGRNRPLNIKEVLNLSIPVPLDESADRNLVMLVRNYMALQVAVKQEETLLHEYKNKLISDVVTGRMDVRGIEVPDYEYVEDEAEETDEESDGSMEEEDGQ